MPLLNPFIDSIVCVGFNSEHGLVIDPKSDKNNSPFLSLLQPYVLAIITADQAIYPQSKGNNIIDQFYPSVCYSKSSSVLTSNTTSQKKHIIPNAFNSLPLFCSPDGVKISHQLEDSRIHHIVFTQEDGKRSYAVVLTFQEQFILKTDKPYDDGRYQIESFTIQSQTKKPKNKIPSSYRHENTTSNKKTTSRMRERSHSISSNRTSTILHNTFEPFYLPHCLILISSYPYWTAMQETISIIHDEIIQSKIEPSSTAYKQLIENYAFLTCNTPIPPIAWERFSLSFNVTTNQSVLTFDPPINTNRTVLDLDLSILLLTFNIGKLLDVLAAILTEQSILFFSSDYSKLVTTLECLLYLIYPFKWIHIYIPIVPDSLSDYYLEGPPGSYIMGVHSRHQSTVEILDLSLTCNLDNDENIHIPSDIKFYRIPSTKLHRFIRPITEFLDYIKTERALQNVHTPIRLYIDEQREFERQHRVETNNKIIEIFLDLMVDLCDDTLKPIYWKIDHQQQSPTNSLTRLSSMERNKFISNQTVFSKEKYLLSKTPGVEQEFYRIFIESTAFQLFIKEEMGSTIPTEFQKTCQLRSQLNRDQPYRLHTKLTDNQVKSTISLFDTTSTKMLLPLPDWSLNTSTHYLDSCIEVFTVELQNAQEERSQSIITVYAYLRGCALLARGHYLDGLRDLYLIDNPNLFPKDYITTTIVPLLSDAFLLDLFLHESFYIESSEWKKVSTHPTHSDTLIINPEKNTIDTIPVISDSKLHVIEDNLPFEQFYAYLHRLSIVVDPETARILFKTLLHWIDPTNKSTETYKPRRRWSISGNPSNETLNTLNKHQQGNQIINLLPNSALPAKRFELFLEIWQQTNAEKARMSSYLPKDRQKQESILIISSSDIVSTKDDHGKLILTQRGLYSLPQAHSSAHILTELIKIVRIETYQHKTIFTSSKPAIRIYSLCLSSSTNSSISQPQDSNPTVSLLFKDNHEQNFWYKIIFELWSAVSIAHEECNITILHKVSRHIALIDTLANIDHTEQILPTNNNQSTKPIGKSKQNCNQATIDTALESLTIYTRMRKTGTFKTLTDETRKVLHDRLSPSINETERYAVRCLIFTENPDNRYSLLWCAYGEKIKMFNTTTWICDPNDLSFPSSITCMCLDACDKLWVGCSDGQIFVVDTIQHIYRTQLASIEGQGGCQTMTFDNIRNQMLIANQAGLIIIWNTNNRQRLIDVNLEEIYKTSYNINQRIYKTEMLINLRNPTEESTTSISSATSTEEILSTLSSELKSIQIYENLLFACYRDDHILIFRITNFDRYTYEDVVSVQYSKTSSIPIHSFLAYQHQLWISAGYIIYVFNINYGRKRNSYHLIMKKYLEDDHLLTMLGFSGYIWAGSSRGNVYIFRMDNYELLKTFNGHKDGVCCLCSMLDMYIISGSQQYDTSIVIWENEQTTDDGNRTRL